jgi:hypothetical protein
VLDESGQRCIIVELDRAAAGEPEPSLFAGLERRERRVEAVDRRNERSGSHCEIARIRTIWPFAIVDAIHDLG